MEKTLDPVDKTGAGECATLSEGSGSGVKTDVTKIEDYRTPQVHSYSSKKLLEALGPARGHGAA